jgi:hypothetical protein
MKVKDIKHITLTFILMAEEHFATELSMRLDLLLRKQQSTE